MKTKELREMTVEELRKQDASLREALFKMRYQNKNNMLDDTQKIVKSKRDIARILTIIKEKENEGGKKTASGKE